MYKLHTSYVIDKKNPKGFVIKDITDVRLIDLFNNYDKIYTVVYNSYNPDVLLGYDLSLNADSLSTQTMTLPEWFASIGNAVIPANNPPIYPVNRYAKYRNAFYAGYQITKQFGENHPDIGYTEAAKQDMLLSRDDVDYVDFLDHALISVNGYYHLATHHVNGILVKGVKDTLQKNPTLDVGITSFKNVCSLDQYPLTSDMIEKDSSGNKLSNRFMVKRPNKNGTLGIVILGRLFIGNPYIRHFNDDYVIIDMTRVELRNLYLKANRDLDLSSMDLHAFDTDENSLDLDRLTDDDQFKSLFEDNTCFMINFHTDRLYEDRMLLDQTELPNRYYSGKPIEGPLEGYLGYLVEYTVREYKGLHVVSTQGCFNEQFLHDTITDVKRITNDVVGVTNITDKYNVAERHIYTSSLS